MKCVAMTSLVGVASIWRGCLPGLEVRLLPRLVSGWGSPQSPIVFCRRHGGEVVGDGEGCVANVFADGTYK